MFEYVDQVGLVASEVMVKPSLCAVLGLATQKNPNTGHRITILISIIIISTILMVSLPYIRRQKYYEKV